MVFKSRSRIIQSKIFIISATAQLSSPQVIATASTTTSNSNVAITANTVAANNAASSRQIFPTEIKSDGSLSPSRPISAASDSSESSTESSTTSEEDEDQEVTFNTIKRRQTKVNVISPKSAAPQPHNDVCNTSSSNFSTTLNNSNSENQSYCDETKELADTNGDNNIKSNGKSAVINLKPSNVYDNKENGVENPTDSNGEDKINGDKIDVTRTPSAASNDSEIKNDSKNTKKEQKPSKSASSLNSVANSFDEHQSTLPGINLPVRFKKANSKNKKSTIRKSDLRNNGCGSESEKKVSK